MPPFGYLSLALAIVAIILSGIYNNPSHSVLSLYWIYMQTTAWYSITRLVHHVYPIMETFNNQMEFGGAVHIYKSHQACSRLGNSRDSLLYYFYVRVKYIIQYINHIWCNFCVLSADFISWECINIYNYTHI
jgi:hypothetical protein